MSDADKSLKTSIETDASQAIAEQERYNKKLQELAQRQEEATKAAKELADAEAYAALKIELKTKASERAAAAAAEEAAYSKTVDAELKKTSKTYTETMADQVAADSKAFTSKAQLKNAFKQLGHEFPLLGQLGRLALNPIAASVSGITGALTLWNWRMKEAMETLVGFQSSFDPKALNTEKFDAAAEANERLVKSLRSVIEAYNSIEAASGRAIGRINAEAQSNGKLLEARKKLELAGATTPEARAEIESRYGTASQQADYKRRQDIIDEQKRAGGNLDAESKAKAAEAAGISVMDEKRGAAFAGWLGTDATAASAEVEKRKQRIAELDEYQSQSFLGRANPMNPMLWKYFGRYGLATGGEARAIEENQLGIAQGALDRQSNFNAREPGRAGLRSQRTAALDRSVVAGTGAMEMRTKAAEGQATLDTDISTDALVAKLEKLAAERKAYMEAMARESEDLRKATEAANARAKNQR